MERLGEARGSWMGGYISIEQERFSLMECRYGHTLRLEYWGDTRCVSKCTRCGKLVSFDVLTKTKAHSSETQST